MWATLATLSWKTPDSTTSIDVELRAMASALRCVASALRCFAYAAQLGAWGMDIIRAEWDESALLVAARPRVGRRVRPQPGPSKQSANEQKKNSQSTKKERNTCITNERRSNIIGQHLERIVGTAPLPFAQVQLSPCCGTGHAWRQDGQQRPDLRGGLRVVVEGGLDRSLGRTVVHSFRGLRGLRSTRLWRVEHVMADTERPR